MLARLEPGTKEDIRLFLASKPRDKKFDWTNPAECACGQYQRKAFGGWVNWGDYPALCALNRIAARFETFGTLYDEVCRQWSREP